MKLQQLRDALYAATVRPDVAGVLLKGASNIKNDWQQRAQASSGVHAGGYPRSIRYNPPMPSLGGGSIKIEPQGSGQAKLGAILEYGTATSPPHGDGKAAADAEAPRFLAAMAALGVKRLW